MNYHRNGHRKSITKDWISLSNKNKQVCNNQDNKLFMDLVYKKQRTS